MRSYLAMVAVGLLVVVAPTVAVDTSERAYEKLRHRHDGNPSLAAFEDRLRLIDEVRSELEKAFEQQRTAALDQLLDNTLNVPTTTTPTVIGTSSISDVNALDLLRLYAERFAVPLSASAFTEEEQAVLQHQYAAVIEAAGALIAEKGRSVAAARPEDAMQAMALSLVLPFLHVSDSEWTGEDAQRLPRWISEPRNLRELENVALRAHRPLTAHVFAIQAQQIEDAKATPVTRGEYLEGAADRLLRADRYDEAVICLRTAVIVAREDSDVTVAQSLQFRIAQVLDDTGRPNEAATEVAEMMTTGADAEAWGRAAMLRLKYLCSAGEYSAVVEESDRYQRDERVGGYLPQVLYITWVAGRRGDSPIAAERAKKTILRKFPDHVLGADLYFAEAMEALARSDYDEAQRVLEYVVYRYPQSRLIRRVQDIQKRLSERSLSFDTQTTVSDR